MPERVAQPQHAYSSSPTGAWRLKVTSAPANLAEVRHACEAFCLRCGLDSGAAGDVGLCINEAMSNITRHAYAGATDQPVEITGSCEGDAVHVSIRDWGNGKMPPLEPKHDPLTPGGLGIVCLRKLLDDVKYTPQSQGMLLTMTRRKS